MEIRDNEGTIETLTRGNIEKIISSLTRPGLEPPGSNCNKSLTDKRSLPQRATRSQRSS